MEVCDVEAEESKDIELGEGDRRSEFLFGSAAAAGDNEFPLPNTLPPPSVLPGMLFGPFRAWEWPTE